MLSAVRRLSVATSKNAVRARAAFSTFTDRERGEEAKYIREQEARRKAEMRAKMEAILELEDHHAEKQNLVAVLEEKPKETTLDKLQKWNYFVPLGILVGVPAIVNELIVLDMETQILGCFAFTVAAVYNEFGNAIGDALDSERNEVKAAFKKVDESLLQNVHEAIATNENLLDLEQQVKDVHALTDDMAVVQADYLNHLEEHKYRDAIARKLDTLVALEDTATHAIRNRMLTAVHDDVLTTFKTDKKAKDAALAQAMAVLAGSNATTGGKQSTDVVGSYFANALKTYKDNYAKQPEGSDAIITQLEADMKAVMTAPEVSHKGGNVYEFSASK